MPRDAAPPPPLLPCQAGPKPGAAGEKVITDLGKQISGVEAEIFDLRRDKPEGWLVDVAALREKEKLLREELIARLKLSPPLPAP